MSDDRVMTLPGEVVLLGWDGKPLADLPEQSDAVVLLSRPVDPQEPVSTAATWDDECARYARPLHRLTLTIPQAAEILNVRRECVEDLLTEGRLPFVREGDRRMILAQELYVFKSQHGEELEDRIDAQEARDALADPRRTDWTDLKRDLEL